MNDSISCPSTDYRDGSTADEAIALPGWTAQKAHVAQLQSSTLPVVEAQEDTIRSTVTQAVIDKQNLSAECKPVTIEADKVQAVSLPTPVTRLNIAEHDQSELIIMLSSLLSKITYSNDNIHSGPEPVLPLKPNSPLLAFHARNIPSISIQAYLSRILKYCPMSSDIFLSLLVYFDRMSNTLAADDRSPQVLSTFTSTRQLMGDEKHPLSIDSYNVHRLVITGIVVASKFCSDVFYTNSRYAKVGGLPLSELNHLEFQFLLMNDFRLMIQMEELQKYGDQLLNFWYNEPGNKQRNGLAAN